MRIGEEAQRQPAFAQGYGRREGRKAQRKNRMGKAEDKEVKRQKELTFQTVSLFTVHYSLIWGEGEYNNCGLDIANCGINNFCNPTNPLGVKCPLLNFKINQQRAPRLSACAVWSAG
jgi:hypothetical protein